MSPGTSGIPIRMSGPERALFERSLAHKPIYLEFGCGGSTELAVAVGCPIVVSVDSDRAWIDRLAEKPAIRDRMQAGSLTFHHVDIGPVGDWGTPRDESKIRNWPRYCLAPFGQGLEYRYILVDGRFRKACALAAWSFMFDDTILAVHDYTVRSDLHDIERFFDVQDVADTLVLFRKKRVIITESFTTTLLNSLFNY